MCQCREDSIAFSSLSCRPGWVSFFNSLLSKPGLRGDFSYPLCPPFFSGLTLLPPVIFDPYGPSIEGPSMCCCFGFLFSLS